MAIETTFNFYFTGSFNFTDKDCVQQSNGYDCGIYVICNAQKLAEYASTRGEIGSCDMLVKINPSAKRKEIIAIIQKLSHSD